MSCVNALELSSGRERLYPYFAKGVVMITEKKSTPDWIITIDGPAGAGKTSVSKQLARELGYRYLDTGALYRAVAVAAHEAGIESQDDAALTELCRGLVFELSEKDGQTQILLNGRDITAQLRLPHISMLASAVSARPVVRQCLLDIQRQVGARKKVVAEGRDMGTVVFPHAEVKFFLDADPQIRALRRYDELKAQEDAPSLRTVEEDMLRRDQNDSTRALAPLRPASDAVRVDSSRLPLEKVVAFMLDHIRRNA